MQKAVGKAVKEGIIKRVTGKVTWILEGPNHMEVRVLIYSEVKSR